MGEREILQFEFSQQNIRLDQARLRAALPGAVDMMGFQVIKLFPV